MSKQQKEGGEESKKGERSEGKGKGQRKATSQAGMQLSCGKAVWDQAISFNLVVHIFTHASSIPFFFCYCYF